MTSSKQNQVNMQKATVLIIDDEAPARIKIRNYLSTDIRFVIVGEAENGLQALELIVSLKPDLLILDIQMPGMTGFDVLRLLDDNYPAVIFATAYDEYAIDAFEVSAIDYLLKPFNKQRLQNALKKYLRQKNNNSNQQILTVLDQLKHPEYLTRLPVRRLKRVTLLNVEDISYITSEHRLVNVHTIKSEKFWTGETLDQLQRRLNPEHFFRAHRGSIVNLSIDFEIETLESGRLKLIFPDKTELTVSRAPAIQLRKLFNF